MSYFVKVQDDNAGCTGNQARCLKAPDNWSGSVGQYFAYSEALKGGWVEDPNCQGFNSANSDCSGSGGGNPGTGGSIGNVGLIYEPGNILFVVVDSNSVVEAQLQYSSGTTVGYQLGEAYATAIEQTNYNKRILFSNPSQGTVTITVRVKNTSTTKVISNVTLGSTPFKQNSTASGGTTPTPSTGTLSRAAIQFNPGGPSFVLAELTGTNKALQFRIVSPGYDSNFVTMSGYGVRVDNEDYSLRGSSVSTVLTGTHTVQFRLEGETALLAQPTISVGTAPISQKFFPAGGSGSNQSITAAGYQYYPGSHIFLLVKASTKPEIRFYNSNSDTGWKEAEVYEAAINGQPFDYRLYVPGIAKGTGYAMQVRFPGDTAAKQTFTGIDLNDIQVNKNLTASSGGTGECVVQIQSLAYDSVLQSLTGYATGPDGTTSLAYSLDGGTTLKQNINDYKNLTAGSYVLDAIYLGGTGADCRAKRPFTIAGCTVPAKNAASVLHGTTTPLGGDDLATLNVNYGVSSQQYKYVIYPNTTSGKFVTPIATITQAGGTQVLNLSGVETQPFTTSGAPQYLLEVQSVSDAGCYSALEALTIVA